MLHHRRELLFATIGFVALLVAFFWPATLQGKFLYQGDLTGSDLLELNVPRRCLVTQAIMEGEIPLWEPKIGNGTQLLAEGHPGPFFPLTVPLYALFSPTAATNLTILLTLFTALLGCYVWLRTLGASPVAASLAAVAFSLGGTFIFRLKNLNIIEIIALTPLCLALITRYRQRAHWGYIAALVLVWAAQLVAGHPQAAFIAQVTCWSYIILILGVDVVQKSACTQMPKTERVTTSDTSPANQPNISPANQPNTSPATNPNTLPNTLLGVSLAHPNTSPDTPTDTTPDMSDMSDISSDTMSNAATAVPRCCKGRMVASLVAAAILALMLSAIQLLPTFVFASESTRAQQYSDEYLINQSLNTHHFARFLAPYCDGNPTIATFTLTRQDLIWESTPYLGLLPLFFVILAFAGKRRRLSVGLVILAAFFLTLAFGPRTFLFNLLSRYFPGFGFFRYPERFIIPMALFLSALGALGLQTALDWGNATGERRRQVVAWVVVGLTVIDLFRVSSAFQSYLPGDWYETPQSLQAIGENHQRIIAPNEWLTMYNSVAEKGWRDDVSPVLADIESLPPDLAPIWNVQSASDYNIVGGGMSIGHFTELFTWLSANLFNTTYNPSANNFFIQPAVLPWLKLGNISHIVTYIPLKDGAKSLGVEQEQAIRLEKAPGRTLYIYRLANSVPALRLVPQLVDTPPVELSKGMAPLEFHGDSLYEPDTDHLANIGAVKVVNEGRNYLELDCQCDTSCYLVMSRTYHPQWLASVDGHAPQPVLKVNYAYQGVALPAGSHRVSLRFTYPAFDWGWKISLLGWIFWACWVTVESKRRQKTESKR